MSDIDVLGGAPTRDQIDKLEKAMLEMSQVDIPTVHDFAPGLYVRTITVPAGVTLTGKAHATDHVFIISKGDMTLVSEEGRKRVQAPYQAVSKAGTKRVIYAHSETVCTNIHITTETDLFKLESELIVADLLPAPATTEEII